MKILIATDGSEFSLRAIEKACEMLASGVNNEVEIISVYDEAVFTGTDEFSVSAEYIREAEKAKREQASKFTEEAKEIIQQRFEDFSAQITTKVVKGAAGRAIVEEAQDWGADLIVTGSHGYGFWGRSFLGSTSDKVMRLAPCSVLIVRKKADADDDADK